MSVRCWSSQNQSWSWRRERVGEWIRKGWWKREKMGREQECVEERERLDGEEVVMMKKEVVSAPCECSAPSSLFCFWARASLGFVLQLPAPLLSLTFSTRDGGGPQGGKKWASFARTSHWTTTSTGLAREGLPYNKSTRSLFWLEPCGEGARQPGIRYAENDHDGRRACLTDRHCFREMFLPGCPRYSPRVFSQE